MQLLKIFVLLGFIIEANFAYAEEGLRALVEFNPKTWVKSRMYYREIEGEFQYLYTLFCSSDSHCSLQVISVGSGKNKIQTCMVDIVNLFQNEPATNPQPGTYIVSLSGGACKYTNTYTFSPNGMVQVKTSPEKPASNLCKAFPPKTSNIPVDSNPALFENVPIEGCKTLNFLKAL